MTPRRRTVVGRPLMYWFRGVPNAGDALSPDLVEALTGRRPVHARPFVRGKIVAIGSILHEVRAHDLVWGSGLIRDTTISLPPHVEVHALRGPLTAERIGSPCTVFGDPAILTPLVHPADRASDGRTLVVTHLRDHAPTDLPDDCTTVSAMSPWQTLVDLIVRSEFVLSSSLHGVVLAEAYGVPALHITLSGAVTGGNFKFRDHLAATGRTHEDCVTLAAGLERRHDRHVAPSFVEQRRGLLAAFRDVAASTGLPLSSVGTSR